MPAAIIPTVLRLKAPNDPNGNPRRLFVVLHANKVQGVYDEGYIGSAAIPQWVHDMAGSEDRLAMTLAITPKQYTDLKREYLTRSKPARRNPGPGYESGKFNTALDEVVYTLGLEGFDDAVGDANEFGYYQLLSTLPYLNVKQQAAELGLDVARIASSFRAVSNRDLVTWAILHEDTQGFVNVTYFDTEKKADTAWGNIQAEYEEFVNGVSDE